MLTIIGLLLMTLLGAALLRKQVKTKTRQLSDSNTQLQATVNAIPDLMFEVDLDGRFYSYHSSRIDLLGQTCGSLSGQDHRRRHAVIRRGNLHVRDT